MCLCVWCYGLVVTGSRPDLHLLGLVLTGKHWKAIVVFVCWYQVVFYLQTETICLVSAQAQISWNCVGVVSRDCALCALLYLWLKSLEKSLNPGLCELCCDKKEPNPVSGQSVQLLMELIKSCLVDPSCNMSDKISHTDLSLLPGMAQPGKWSPCYLRYLERTCLFSCPPSRVIIGNSLSNSCFHSRVWLTLSIPPPPKSDWHTPLHHLHWKSSQNNKEKTQLWSPENHHLLLTGRLRTKDSLIIRDWPKWFSGLKMNQQARWIRQTLT